MSEPPNPAGASRRTSALYYMLGHLGPLSPRERYSVIYAACVLLEVEAPEPTPTKAEGPTGTGT